MKNNIKLFAILITIITLVGCKDKAEYKKINTSQIEKTNDLHKIVVKEKVDGGGYVYLNVTEDGNDYWMAIATMSIEVGNTYYYNGGMVMKDFVSKHLDKTFDFITFAEGVRSTEEIQVSNEQAHEHSNQMVESVGITEKVEKAIGGTSLEELFKGKSSFNKKSIIVKGKVVKVNNGIMDKNWVHIEDGTQFNNERDLTITTNEEVKEGDIVTFKGTIVLNKDFGAGYVYDIVLEEGTLVK